MNASLTMDEVFIKKLRDIVANNIADENFSVEELAKEAGLSRFSLYRRLRSAKQKDATLFIREIRLQKAMEMLKLKEGTVAEIAFRVGFGSPTYFNKCFHEYYGYPPGEIRKNISETSEVSMKVVEPVSSHKKRNKAAIFAGLIILFALIAFGLFIIPKMFTSDERSIAVLPFKLLSNEPDKQYLADGMMDAITLHLSKIKDLRVMSRTSVEQYRGTTKTSREIGKELDVEYLLEGSFQKFGDNVKLIVQLINASEESSEWANDYDRNWKDIISIQSEVAQSIAKELKATITPDEKQLIEKVPTSNLTAYDFYQRGVDELYKFTSDYINVQAFKIAKEMYRKALGYDSTFAQAYNGLAWVYFYKNALKSKSYYSENYLDSCFILANRALSFDDRLAEAYYLRGLCYYFKGNTEQGLKECDKAIKYNPNYGEAYTGMGFAYSDDMNKRDFVKSIECYHKAASLNHGKGLPSSLRNLGWAYGFNAGFYEKGKYYYQEAFNLDGDSSIFFRSLGELEICFGNFKKGYELHFKNYLRDSTNFMNFFKFNWSIYFLGNYKEALKYTTKIANYFDSTGTLMEGSPIRIAHIYWENGYRKEAELWLNQHKKYYEDSFKFGRKISNEWAYAALAGGYAFGGDKEKAYENLRKYANSRIFSLWEITMTKIDPLYNSMRNEPEFQKILKEMEAKYQAEHERVRKWLEEKGEL